MQPAQSSSTSEYLTSLGRHIAYVYIHIYIYIYVYIAHPKGIWVSREVWFTFSRHEVVFGLDPYFNIPWPSDCGGEAGQIPNLPSSTHYNH